MFRIIVSLLLGIGLSHLAPAQQKRALLIGVGNYPRSSGWKSLSSANDLRYLQQVLLQKGFDASNIQLLLDSAATYDGISQAVEKLIASCTTGDIVMLHFSGHGQQISDDDNDEADGYDEAWIPYDAQARFDPVQYRGTKHLRDDVIGGWVNRLSAAVGNNGSILITIDACHSGTATRAQELAIARGVPVPFKIPGKTRQVFQGSTPTADFLSKSNLEKANIIVFSASSPTQVNYETTDAANEGVGSLSYGFAQVLATLPAGATYSDLFYRIKARIQAGIPGQLPMMEGNGKQLLFSGKYSAGDGQVYIDRWATDTTFTVKMGSLQQLAEGAELAILDAGTQARVSKAIVTQVGIVESMATVHSPLDKNKAYLVKILALPAPPYRIVVDYNQATLSKAWTAALDKTIGSFGFAQKGVNADCWISLLPDTGLAIITRDRGIAYLDASVTNGKLTDKALQDLKQPLQELAKSNYLRNLPDGGPLTDMVVWEVVSKDGRSASEHELSFAKGETFNLRLKNKSKQAVYFALINLLPDGRIEVLVPDAESSPEDFNIQPGESFAVEDNSIPANAVPGREFLRVMVSYEPFDIRPVFNAKAPTRKGNLSSWEQAMRGIMQDDNVGLPKKRSVSVNEITLLTQSFTVQ